MEIVFLVWFVFWLLDDGSPTRNPGPQKKSVWWEW